MPSNHEAGFAKLGYLYQIRYALYKAIEDYDAYYIRLESLDDVVVNTVSSSELFQLKHHIAETNLSNMSVDFWKTIGIWAAQIFDENLDTEEFKFYLVTTSNVKKGTIASFLLDEMRDIDKAVELMNQASEESKNDLLKSSIAHFQRLSLPQKKQLCKSIVILPNESNAKDIVDKITRRLELSVDINHVAALYEKLEGWWFGRVVNLLFGNADKIWRDEVRDKVVQLSYEYHPGSLPVDYSDVSLDQKQLQGFMSFQFVRQLELIGVSVQRVHVAILDYYKAYHQRTKWIRDDLLIEYDISDFENRLVESWSHFRLSVLDELGDEGEGELKKAGRSVLNWVQNDADIRIKPKVADRFVMIGSYHMLADEIPARVGWHPSFEKELQKLLEVS